MYQSLRAKLSLLNIASMLKKHFDFGNYYLLFYVGRYSGDELMLVCISPSDTMLEIIETGHLELNVFERHLKSKSRAGYQFYCSRSYK
jgi:hypothetical protein